MANPFPFTAGQVLTAAQMNGIGEWTSYTPVLTAVTTNPNLGSTGGGVGSYARVQNYIVYRFAITFGGTGISAGSGVYKVSLPVTAVQFGAYYSNVSGVASYFDNSTGSIYNCHAWLENTTRLSLLYFPTFNGAVSNVTEAAPFVPATGDSYSGLVIYQAA